MMKTTSTDIDMWSILNKIQFQNWMNFAIGEINFPTCIPEFDCRSEQFRRKRVSNIIDDWSQFLNIFCCSERKQWKVYCCLGQLGASSKSSVAASTLLPSSVAEFLKASSSSPIDELLIRNLIKGIIVVQNLQRWLFWPRLKVNIFHWHLSKWVHEIVFVE